MYQIFIKKLEKSIEWGLYLFVFLLPWQTRLILREGNLNGYWEYGTISVYATEILLWAIFAMTAVLWTIGKLKNPKSQIQISNKIQNPKSKFAYLLICLFAFLLYSSLSIFWSDSKSVALLAWVRLAEGIGLFLVLRVVKFDVIKLAWAFVASTIIQAGLGAWQFLAQATFASKWLGMALHDPSAPGTFVVETALRRWLRAYGSLPHPNMLAGFLAMGMLFLIWLYQKTAYGLKKLLLPVCFTILTLGILTTFSKSVTVALGIAAIFLWASALITRQSKEVKINLLKFTLIFLVIATIFSAIFWEPVSTRLYGQDRLEVKSSVERLSYFDQAWQLIKKHPFLGVGIGNYTLAAHNEINPDLKSWDYQPVHNIYLLILAELGIVGFVFVILLFCYFVILLLKLIKEKKFLEAILFSAPVLLLIVGFFDHYLWTLYFGVMLFWLALGIAYKRSPLDTLFEI
jgi:O-antigen ligase